MMKKIITITAIFTILSALIPLCAVNALNIKLHVKERSGVDRIDEPVTSGVPLSREDNITGIDELGIYDQADSPIPAQFRVLSRYEGEPADEARPIRVVLVDFQGNVSANNESNYYLKNNGSGTIAEPEIASEDAIHITIETGTLTAKINKTDFSLFDEVAVAGKTLVTSGTDDGIFVEYQGTTYSSKNTPTSAVIEENGPLRAVILVKGYFEDQSGNKLFPPLGDNGISYTVRFKAYKDKSYVKVDFRLENENQGWTYQASDPVHNINIESCHVTTSLDGIGGQKTIAFQGYTDTFTEAAYELVQRELSDGSEMLYDWEYRIKKDGIDVSTGDRYDSFVNLGDDTGGLMVAERWFWQNHPNGVNVENNKIHLTLWPDIEYTHRILGGIWKTHELIYYFHEDDVDFANELAAIKKRLIARCSDMHYASTNFFSSMVPDTFTTGHTFPAGEELQTAIDLQRGCHRAKYDQSYITNTHATNTLFSLRNDRRVSLSATQYATWYGWLEFGDIPRGADFGYTAQHYDWSYLSLMGFLRFGDYNMLDIGEEFVSHKADIIVVHDPYAVRGDGLDWNYHGGQRFEKDALFSYNYDYGPNTSAARKASHFWTSGMTVQYMLTGDERYRETVTQCYDHVVRVMDDGSMTNLETRNQNRGIDALVNGYQLTGKQVYLDAAYNIFTNHLLDKEGGTGDGASGWIASNSATYVAGLYDSIQTQALVTLYLELVNAGENSKAADLMVFLLRWGNWARNTLFTINPNGTYRNNNTEYYPFMMYRYWDSATNTFVDHADGQYSMPYADLFALLYVVTEDENWLNLARSVFKDWFVYGNTDTWTAVKNEGLVNGFFSEILTGHWKIAKTLTKPLYYLRTEWLENRIVPGDLNGDGSVTLADALAALQICVSLDPQASNPLNGDVDLDGTIDIKEAVYILRTIAIP